MLHVDAMFVDVCRLIPNDSKAPAFDLRLALHLTFHKTPGCAKRPGQLRLDLCCVVNLVGAAGRQLP